MARLTHFGAILTVCSPRTPKYPVVAPCSAEGATIGATSATVEIMGSATAWNVTGVGRETRAFAEAAARRAGMSLADWLDEAVADKAAEQGVDPVDLEADDRLDAIGERISRLSRRDERSDEGWRAPARDEARGRRGDPAPSRSRRAAPTNCSRRRSPGSRVAPNARKRAPRAPSNWWRSGSSAAGPIAARNAPRSRPSPRSSTRSTSAPPERRRRRRRRPVAWNCAARRANAISTGA